MMCHLVIGTTSPNSYQEFVGSIRISHLNHSLPSPPLYRPPECDCSLAPSLLPPPSIQLCVTWKLNKRHIGTGRAGRENRSDESGGQQQRSSRQIPHRKKVKGNMSFFFSRDAYWEQVDGILRWCQTKNRIILDETQGCCMYRYNDEYCLK